MIEPKPPFNCYESKMDKNSICIECGCEWSDCVHDAMREAYDAAEYDGYFFRGAVNAVVLMCSFVILAYGVYCAISYRHETFPLVLSAVVLVGSLYIMLNNNPWKKE